MSKAPKYTFRVVEKRNNTWTAEIQRQATSKKKVVSKRQTGFATEADGVTWAEQELKQILENHVARNKRHDAEREDQYQAKIKQAELERAELESDDSAPADTSTDENVIAEVTTADVAATEDSSTDGSAADEDKELVGKPKFDFEIAMEEAELAEKAERKKRKATKTAESKPAEDLSSVAVDGSTEVNDIYKQNK